MYDVNLIKSLSQNEGLNDREIGEKLNVSRVTITRIRKRESIPRCNKNNKMDKTYICLNCGNKITIRRKDRRQAFCEPCKKLINN